MALNAQYGNLDAFYGNLDAFWGNLDAFYGNLDAFYGNLDAFYGNLDAFGGGVTAQWGNLDAFWGNLDAFYGNLDAFWGNLDAFYGNLDAFAGQVDPMYGNLDAFYGNLDAFYGNLDAFWGNLDAFEGSLNGQWGNLDAFYGNLDAFWGNLDAFWGNLDAFWGNLDAFDSGTKADYRSLRSNLEDFYGFSLAHFGAAVTAQTGQDFYNGFAKELFDEYGITLNNKGRIKLSDLEGWTPEKRARFFSDWYDGLMGFTGFDRTDHWMRAVNWSPTISQDFDLGSHAKIGLLDFGVTDAAVLENNVTYVGGFATDADDFHGSAVISLMVAPQDGSGLIGLAPGVEVAAYNPFDETNTAGWADVELGLDALIDRDVSVINMSLGVPGEVVSQEWADIIGGFFDKKKGDEIVFVKAAGNEGAIQLADIDWSNARSADWTIFVGALGIDGEIADFSNTPGDACFVAASNGGCESYLRDRFIVAPGEFMLVSDGQGGTTRVSGTSFAAPLVTGTVALVHSYWPWWENQADETVQVILESATDLGAEGVDDVYGHGLLNVEGALSPLNFDTLVFYRDLDGDGNFNVNGKGNFGRKGVISAAEMRSQFLSMDLTQLEDDGAAVLGIEYIGDTYRDFRIPLSTLVYGNDVQLKGWDRGRKFQRHMHQRFIDWANGASLTDVQTLAAPLGLQGEWTLAMTATPYAPGTDVRDGALPFQTDMTLANPETGTTFRFGNGQAAALTHGSQVFGFYSDFEKDTGGVNPFLGFASGGAYAEMGFALNDRFDLSVGLTEASDDHTYADSISGEREAGFAGLPEYKAMATNVVLGADMGDTSRVTLGYTRLAETDSLLGDQGSSAFGFGGATTDAVTLGYETAPMSDLTLAISATMGTTHAVDDPNRFFGTGEDGMTSTAFAIGLHKHGLFRKGDQARFSLSQPLTVEQGALAYTSVQVTDRSTGELGVVTEEWAIATNRTFVAEGFYATSLLEGVVDVSGFGRLQFNEQPVAGEAETDFSVGGRLAIKF